MARCPVFMIAGDLAAYFLGLLIEYEWGSHASLIIFLALYFLFSLGVLGPRDVGGLWYFQCNVALPSARWQHCGHEVRPAGADRAIPACGLLLWSCVGSR